MTLKTPSKPSSEQQPMPSPPRSHQDKQQCSLAVLLPELRSTHRLCSRLLSSHHSEYCKSTLHLLEEDSLSSLRLLEDHLISLSDQESKPDDQSSEGT